MFYGSIAQTPPLRNFSVKEGLPSGIVYDCLEDRNGYMWFATEAGLARFDGINFKVYTTEDGLSNNSILQLIEDNDGSIWIFPFGTSPCIFDWQQQKIITAKENAVLAELGKFAEHLSALKIVSGIILNADGYLYLVENRKISKIWNDAYYSVKPIYNTRDSLILLVSSVRTGSAPVLMQRIIRQNGKWEPQNSDTLNSDLEHFYFAAPITAQEDFGPFKIFSGAGQLSVFEGANQPDPRFKFYRAFTVNGMANSLHSDGDYLYVCTASGILKYDHDLKLIEKLWPDHSFSKFFLDRKGNKWYCKLDGSGVMMALGNGIKNIDRTEGLSAENVSSLLLRSPGVLLAGNADGTIQQLEWERGKAAAATIVRLNARIRQIVNTGTIALGISDREIAVIRNLSASVMKYPSFSFKAALADGEGKVLLSHSSGISQADNNMENAGNFAVPFTRVSTISYFNDTVYFGNNKGLYYLPGYHRYYDLNAAAKKTIIDDPVTAVSYATDSIVWVGTNTRGIIIYRHNKLFARVPSGTSPSGGNYLIKRIYPEPAKKRVWVATNKGLQQIRYRVLDDSVVISSRFYTSRDGLADDDVNDVVVSGDTVFAATIKGISYFRDSLQSIVVPISITGLTLNETDSTLPAASAYNFKYSKSNFSVHYSGICYTCDGKIVYRYRLLGPDRDTNWISTPVNTVEFGGLQPGRYVFQVTTDASSIAETIIIVEPAFWQEAWFYVVLVLAAVLVTALAARWYIRRLKRNNEKRIEQNKKLSELELRALQSQMNPHFIFNSMNSLQKFILTNDISNANEYLAGFSKLLRLFLDASRNRFIPVSKEVELLRLYIELEQMRQMTKFSYELKVADNISQDLLIPSVIIQPFVENAIVHGLRYLEDKPGQLRVEMTRQGSLFSCIITDNGVGRKKAKEIQAQKAQQYKSYGTSIIEEKIETLRKMENINITVDIKDRQEEDGGGTVVTINFKAKETI